MLQENVGTWDRILRIVFGLAILSLVFFGPQTLWAWLGMIPFTSGVLGWCPLYRLVGINTCTMTRGGKATHSA